MRKLFVSLIVAAAIIVGLGRASIELPFVQDFGLDRVAGLFARQGSRSSPEVDGLRVYVCGSASPLGVTDQAQACVATHSPIEPAVGYRFDYKGRSVVISGDSTVTEETEKITDGVDLLLHDALSLPVVSTLAGAAGEAGLDRMSKIMLDVMDYHASTASLVELSASVDIDMVALYHLVPSPANLVVKKIFERDLPSNFLLAEDGIWFELPAGSEKIEVTYP